MHLECPHCRAAIELVEPAASVSCPSCGSEVAAPASGSEAETAPLLTSRRMPVVSRYRLLGWAGRGKFGDVWKAFDPELDRFVALKIPHGEALDSEQIRLFLREAQAQAQLNHPHIVKVLDTQRQGSSVVIVSDFVHGVTLHDWLGDNLPAPEQTARICATIARAVHHAHEKGIVHRDLKPSNIMLNDEEEPFVLDFGLAKREAADFTIAVDGAILGTPAYMSPEQARGNAGDADARSDVYSLGVILYRMLTGQTPFKGGNRLLLHRILNEEPARPRKLNPTIPRDLETICLKAMDKDPARRYLSALAFAEDLDRFRAGEAIEARPISPLERGWRWARRNPAFGISLGALLVLSVIIGLIGVYEWTAYRADLAARYRWVNLATQPPGARVVFVPVDPDDRRLYPERAVRPVARTPLSGVRLEPGYYLVVAALNDNTFHEVFRTVPDYPEQLTGNDYLRLRWSLAPDGTIDLPSLALFSHDEVLEGMVRLPGGRFLYGPPAGETDSPRPVTLAPFYMDAAEVTQADWRQQYGDLGKVDQHPELRGDRLPMVLRNFHQVMEYAELVGKRLPVEEEYEFAATGGGRYPYPWGSQPPPDEPWQLSPVDAETHDLSLQFPGLRNLYSSAAEWQDSMLKRPHSQFWLSAADELNRAGRVVRGAPEPFVRGEIATRQEVLKGPKQRYGELKDEPFPGLGFRCVRSAKPRFLE